jgi:hypothetical protein
MPKLVTSKINLKDDFIDKVENLYTKVVPSEVRKLKYNEIKKNEFGKVNQVDTKNDSLNKILKIKELWNWVKSLVRFQENNLSLNRTLSHNTDIKNKEFSFMYEKICKENGIKSYKDFNLFMEKVISNWHESKKKVDKIKKLLLREPSIKENKRFYSENRTK